MLLKGLYMRNLKYAGMNLFGRKRELAMKNIDKAHSRLAETPLVFQTSTFSNSLFTGSES